MTTISSVFFLQIFGPPLLSQCRCQGQTTNHRTPDCKLSLVVHKSAHPAVATDGWCEGGTQVNGFLVLTLQESIASIVTWEAWLSRRSRTGFCGLELAWEAKCCKYFRKFGAVIQPDSWATLFEHGGAPFKKSGLILTLGKIKKGGSICQWHSCYTQL